MCIGYGGAEQVEEKSLSSGSRTCEAREEVEMCSLIAGANKIVPHPVPCSERY